MTPVDQVFLSNKEKGVVGDCVRAATASLLNLPVNKVPHFVALYDFEWCSHWEDWIESLGYDVISMPKNENWVFTPDCYHLAAGTTIRETRHMIVRKGAEVAHDPHPSRAGLEKVDSVWIITPKELGRPINIDVSSLPDCP